MTDYPNNILSDEAFANIAYKYKDKGTFTKAQFNCLTDEIWNCYKKGYSIKSIWRTLYENGKINIGYVQFFKLFKNLQKNKGEF